MSILSVLLGVLFGVLAYWVTSIFAPDRRIALVVGIVVFILVAFSLIPIAF